MRNKRTIKWQRTRYEEGGKVKYWKWEKRKSEKEKRRRKQESKLRRRILNLS